MLGIMQRNKNYKELNGNARNNNTLPNKKNYFKRLNSKLNKTKESLSDIVGQ